jgi:hypothetical protein
LELTTKEMSYKEVRDEIVNHAERKRYVFVSVAILAQVRRVWASLPSQTWTALPDGHYAVGVQWMGAAEAAADVRQVCRYVALLFLRLPLSSSS